METQNPRIERGMYAKAIPNMRATESFDCTQKTIRPDSQQFVEHLRAKDKVFCLPGEKWIWENELYELRPVRFSAVESAESTFLRIGGYAPRIGRFRYWQIDSPQGVLDCCGNLVSMVVKSTVYDVLTNSRAFGNHRKGQHYAWFGFKKNTNAFWFDTCSTLSHKLLTSLAVLPSWADLGMKVLPFAITFVRARDSFRSDEYRQAVLLDALKATGHFHVREQSFINYAGIGGVPMCLMQCSLVVQKTKWSMPKVLKQQVMHVHARTRTGSRRPPLAGCE